jgi:flagellar basal-body rod protein FlgF
VTATGHAVMGDSGTITVPPANSITLASDGTVSVVPLGQTPLATSTVGRIKLVNPPASALATGPDGLFRLRSGSPAEADAQTTITAGVLEASNVNLASSMVNMIELSRRFDLQVKALHTADDDAASATKLLQST